MTIVLRLYPDIAQGDSASSRVNQFFKLDPPVFTEAAEVASYRLKEVAYSWFELWEESREKGSPQEKWREFSNAFIDHFLPAETRAARGAEFEKLRKGSMSVWDYHMRFAHLSKCVVYMLLIMEARVHRFVQGLSPLVINEAATTALNYNKDYGRMVAFAQATEAWKLKARMKRKGSKKDRSAGNFGGSSNGSSG
nr:uncharacterized protein LOC117280322 [Nicotiana tomentosiformis]